LKKLKSYLLNLIAGDFHLKELFRGGSIALVYKLGGALMSYVLVFVIARIYGAEGVGVYSTSWTILLISAVIAKMGFDTSIVRFIAENKMRKNVAQAAAVYRSMLKVLVISALCTGSLIIIAAPFLDDWFFSSEINRIAEIRLVGFGVFLLSIMSFNAESFRGLKKITLYSFFQNGTIYFFTLIIILAFYLFSPTNIRFIIMALVTAILLMVLISFYFVKRNRFFYAGDFTGKQSAYKLRSIFLVSFPMLLSNSLFFVMNWTDILMLSAFTSESLVGIYSTCVKIAAVNAVALVAINSIASPKFAEFYASKDMIGLKRFVKQTTMLNLSISMPAFLAILFLPEFLLSIFGEEFIEGVKVLLLLAAGQLFNAFCGSTMPLLNMTGKEKTGRNILFLGAVVNFALNYLLIPRFGMMGAAMATTSSTVLWNALAVFFIHKYYGFTSFPIRKKT
jgi:O-antigen/teichoic acid export membrane protein